MRVVSCADNCRATSLVMSSHYHLLHEGMPTPKLVTTVGPHPSHPMMTVFAKFSPNPSITPFTNSKSMLMDSDETKDQKHVLTGSVLSNTARAIEATIARLAVGVAWGVLWVHLSLWCWAGSANDHHGGMGRNRRVVRKKRVRESGGLSQMVHPHESSKDNKIQTAFLKESRTQQSQV